MKSVGLSSADVDNPDLQGSMLFAGHTTFIDEAESARLTMYLTAMTLILSNKLPTSWRAGMAWPAAIRDNQGQRAFFRCAFELNTIPDSFQVFVSADSRYRLYLNGEPVGRGPLKGTLRRYHLEEYDLAGLLREGRNVLAADVVWFGYRPPLSVEHSGFPGFLLQGPDGAGIDTPGIWKAHADTSTTWDMTGYTSNAHIFLSGMEHVEGASFPTGWNELGFDNSGWGTVPMAVPVAAAGGDKNPGASGTSRRAIFPR